MKQPSRLFRYSFDRGEWMFSFRPDLFSVFGSVFVSPLQYYFGCSLGWVQFMYIVVLLSLADLSDSVDISICLKNSFDYFL